MATLAEIRAGIAANLAAVFGVTVQTNAYALGNPTPPTIEVIGPEDVEYDQSMARGLDMWTLKVRGLVGDAADQGAQVNLDLWIAGSGADSVKTAIEADKTLGGKVESLWVESCTGYQLYQLPNNISVLGAEWSVVVFNTGH
jgi:hypothetical protein